MMSLYSPTSLQSSTIQIEVQMQKSSEISPQKVKNLNLNKVIEQTSPIAETQTATAQDIPQSEDQSIVMGRDIGINALYPRLSRIIGENGLVVIEIKNDIATVLKSSGYARLDQSALIATQEALKAGQLSQLLENKTNIQIRFIFKLIEEK